MICRGWGERDIVLVMVFDKCDGVCDCDVIGDLF